MARAQELFTTVTSQGGLLPADLLARVAAGDGKLGGLAPADYGLVGSERISEMANRSWNRLQGAWATFRPLLRERREGEALTGPTRERWLQVLFQELGFGRLPQGRPLQVDDRDYPVFTVWGERARVPLHLVGAGVDLDRRSAGVAGAARTSPHSLVQELLNAWDEALWGVVTNGLRLRLLRDNSSLTRQAYCEFDLEATMEGEVYSDFALLWSLVHVTRFEGAQPAECWLERWRDVAESEGTRALNQLGNGVREAIRALGQGFLAHPSNPALREALRSGGLGTQDYYRLLLRLVYRLLFLLVAEARELLLSPDARPEARDRYQRYYSVARLRRLAERQRSDRHDDLWVGLQVVMEALHERGQPALGLRALGSFLWAPESIAALGSCCLSNAALLRAVRELAFVTGESGRVRLVDYRNLGPEELGSVYEGLLELHPEVHLETARFELATEQGNERKTTGSYYTPTSLIVSLLDTALDPVLAEAARAPDPERAILALRVVDPACGSGHFLLAAAQRIARRLAEVRTGDEEPPPAAMRTALRDVIGHCLCGVDVNPMAVELCKVSLWIEALDPARPLNFFDHRILCGHSLLGATPRLLADGIPDEAYKPIEGDEKQVVATWKKDNKKERGGQDWLPFEGRAAALQASLAAGVTAIASTDDTSLAGIHAQEARFRSLLMSPEQRRMHLEADAWCAAFVAPKRQGEPVITDRWRRALVSEPERVPGFVRERVEELARRYRFFHWHLAFPDVFRLPGPSDQADNEATGWSGGFDVVLGNPPWERVKLQEQEFFAARAPEIAKLPGARRKRRIAELRREDPALDTAYREALREAEGASHFLRDSGRFPLCGRGDVNTYSVFAETMRTLVGPRGRAGIIVPTGIATDDTTKEFFASLVEGRNLASLYDFENAAPLFPAVHRSFKFCLLTMTGAGRPVREGGEFCFFAHQTGDLLNPERRFRLTAEDFRLFNPNTKTCPIFRTRRDAEITRRIYERVPVLIDRTRGEEGNPWGISFKTLFHMTNDSALFRPRAELEAQGWTLRGNVFERGEERYLPLYEGKMFHHFDHRWASYENGEWRELTVVEKQDPHRLALPRYWVAEVEVDERLNESRCIALWRRIARTTDERTCIATVIPVVGVGDSGFIAAFRNSDTQLAGLWIGASGSLCFDYVVRQKLGGTNLSFFYFEQLPFPDPRNLRRERLWGSATSAESWLTSRVAELACTALDMQPLARELGYDYAPFRWDEARRELLRAELDAAFFHLYSLSREELADVMDTFPIVRRKDEADHGEYRTKRLILERYDALAEAIATGTPYPTVLDPPPADPRVAHRSRASPGRSLHEADTTATM